MPNRMKAIAFEVDLDSLGCLRQALPSWEIEAVTGTTPGSLDRDWNPEAADLLVVGAREPLDEVLRFCRCLRSQTGRAQTPLLLLLLPTQEISLRSRDAGTSRCLTLPLTVDDLANLVTRAVAERQSAAKGFGSDRSRRDALWQDDGGEG